MPEQVYEQHRLLKKVVSLQLRIARRTNLTVALLERERSFCPGLEAKLGPGQFEKALPG